MAYLGWYQVEALPDKNELINKHFNGVIRDKNINKTYQ